jgi:hypothetical protein
MPNYIFITSKIDGYLTSEIHEISNSDLAAIRPVITAMLNATEEDRKETVLKHLLSMYLKVRMAHTT